MKRSLNIIDFASINNFSLNDKGIIINLSSLVPHVVFRKEQNYFGEK